MVCVGPGVEPLVELGADELGGGASDPRWDLKASSTEGPVRDGEFGTSRAASRT
jgi:hypothetical protein